MPVDEAKLNDLLGRFVVDVGAGFGHWARSSGTGSGSTGLSWP